MNPDGKRYFVYIVASKTRRTYIGMTSNLEQRVWQHRNGTFDGHTKKYKKHHLVHVEEFQWVHDAIVRERELKGWLATRKSALVEAENPEWRDLSEGWFE